MAQQIMFPWGQYKVSELARVVGATRGQTMTALRRLGIVSDRVYRKGIPADQTSAVEDELRKVAAEREQRHAKAKQKRDEKAARKRAA